MAHGTICEFDPQKESIEDFHERFEFYCLANNVRAAEGEAADRKKALFITLLGQGSFSKLKSLAHPIAVADLSLDAILQHLSGHYQPKTIEIAERFKFFKRNQREKESVAEFIAELQTLAKTCNFGNYLETAIRDQFVCGLLDVKCQQELLCETELTAEKALQRAQAMEAVARETRNMRAGNINPAPGESCTNAISYGPCYRCGYKGHPASMCRFKTAKCHICQKTGHLARVCRSKKQAESGKKPTSGSTGKAGVHQLQNEITTDDSSDSDGGLYNIFQLSNPVAKFIVSVKINGVNIEMEVDSGAQRSTVPWRLFQEELATACRLMPTSVTLRQYDQSPLDVKGECQAEMIINDKAFSVLNISSGVGNGYTCGEMTGLTDTLKSPQILIPPSFLFTTTMGAAHSLCSTGINSPAATCVFNDASTFSFNANGTGR